VRADGRFGPLVCVAARTQIVSSILVVSLVLSIALFAYLIIALFYPEKFL